MFTSISNVISVVFTRIVAFVKSIFTAPVRIWNFFSTASTEEISDLVMQILKVLAVTVVTFFVSGTLVKVAMILMTVESISENDEAIEAGLNTDAPAEA